MNAAEILTAVQEAGAALRVEGGSLVASNAGRLSPEIKTAIRENKPQIITALCAPGRYRKVFLHLQLEAPGPDPGRALALVRRGRQEVPGPVGQSGRVSGLGLA